MTLNDYCSFIKATGTLPRTRVLVLECKEDWPRVRQCYKFDMRASELRVSDLITETDRVPMPDEVFYRVKTCIAAENAPVVVLGLTGYQRLLTRDIARGVAELLRKQVDDGADQQVVFLLEAEDLFRKSLETVFANPRYRSSRQLVTIRRGDSGPGSFTEATSGASGKSDIVLLDKRLAPLAPDRHVTLSKYLRECEDHPMAATSNKIAAETAGRRLAGLSVELKQITTLPQLAEDCYGISDSRLSEEALQWMCETLKKSGDENATEVFRKHFFAVDPPVKAALSVFEKQTGFMQEVLLWTLRECAPRDSYLRYVASIDKLEPRDFGTAYVEAAVDCLNDHVKFAGERKAGIQAATIGHHETSIRRFIKLCFNSKTQLVAHWLNCGTEAEKCEMLRRCAEDKSVRPDVMRLYAELDDYLSDEPVFDEDSVASYFSEYRLLKIANWLAEEFYEKAAAVQVPASIKPRDSLLQEYASDPKCCLLVVDALGAEWLPMLVAQARRRSIGVESARVARANLPSSTEFNKVFWSEDGRRLKAIKRLDNIAHSGAEPNEKHSDEENLHAALSVIPEDVMKAVSSGLAEYKKVVVTGDHGTTRLAVVAWRSDPRLAKTVKCDQPADVLSWRHCIRRRGTACPAGCVESLDGEFWVMSGYDRLPFRGGGQGFEMHGGASLEESLVPVVVFSRTGAYEPTARREQPLLVEKDDFDI